MSFRETMEEIDRQKRSEDAELEAREARAMYRRVFGTPEGTKVLTSMLIDLGLFRETTTPEQAALKNYATDLVMSKIGIKSAGQALRTVEFWLEIGK